MTEPSTIALGDLWKTWVVGKACICLTNVCVAMGNPNPVVTLDPNCPTHGREPGPHNWEFCSNPRCERGHW